MNHPIVVAITGASGAAFGCRLIEVLLSAKREVLFTISPSGCAVMRQELQQTIDPDQMMPANLFATRPAWWRPLPQRIESHDLIKWYRYNDFMTPIASGSFLTGGMVICPCSGGTLSGIAHAASNNLIVRAADVHLKERRKLIVVPRETPLSSLQLENMLRVTNAGGVVLPAMPGWYHEVHSPMDLVDFVVGRILDQLGIVQQLSRRWGTDK